MAAPIIYPTGSQTQKTGVVGLVPIARGPQTTQFAFFSGTVTLTGATPVTVADTAIDIGSQIFFTLRTAGGTPGAYPTAVPTPGTGFTVAGTAGDTSIYNWTRMG